MLVLTRYKPFLVHDTKCQVGMSLQGYFDFSLILKFKSCTFQNRRVFVQLKRVYWTVFITLSLATTSHAFVDLVKFKYTETTK